MLTSREAAIIELIVRSYIDTGEPVSSSEIAGVLEPPVSSATVRNDMGVLTEAGYLLKPHTSAGRVPTAAAYRFVTERMLEREKMSRQASSVRAQNPEALARRVAQRSHAAAYIENRQGVGVAGFEFVLTAPELSAEEAALSAFAHLVDALPRWTRELSGALEGSFGFAQDKHVGVFVAEENPIHKSAHFSIVASRLPNGGVAAVIGPLRMRYDAAIASLRSI